MKNSEDRLVIIGAGANGLVAAAYLARAGLRPLVLERRPVIGGIATTEEFHPGFRCSPVVSAAGPFLARIAGDLHLEKHGLAALSPAVRVFAPSNGRSLVLYDDPSRTAADLERTSPKDAANWKAFDESLSRIGRLLSTLLTTTPPAIDRPSFDDVWRLLQTGWRFRGLPRRDAFRLLRWGPMAVADLAAEWFETEPLRAVIAARGVFGNFAGPWSAGTSANLLLQAAADPRAAGGGAFIRGGMGALATALATAAREAGAEIRTSAEVASIAVRDGGARGVRLVDGKEIPAAAIVSAADPRRTLLNLVDVADLDPDFLEKIRHYRSTGVVARVHLALSALPRFSALSSSSGDSAQTLSGHIHIGPEIDSIERAFDAAKYGRFSSEPYCDVTIPSILDKDLAPAGSHVLSAHVQYAPYRLGDGDWKSQKEALGDAVVRTLAAHAPGLEKLILARQVLTPVDLEETYGLTGGHIFHGEHSLDQLFTMRPVLGWARYRTPIRGLFLCGAGTHPGGGVTGAPGWNASREIVKDLKKL
ncbi:MAG TPA: NAD(P)/FAD-dependent oxidoreductase [Thermoanaerobaculia bacterium]